MPANSMIRQPRAALRMLVIPANCDVADDTTNYENTSRTGTRDCRSLSGSFHGKAGIRSRVSLDFLGPRFRGDDERRNLASVQGHARVPVVESLITSYYAFAS